MPSRGTVRVGGRTYAVKGESWMDREWSTSALGADQVGWDWFSLQLSDGSELMYYQLRRKDGSADRFSSGMWVPPAGAESAEPVKVSREDMRLTVLDTWKSPRSGSVYPARWRLRVEKLGLDLTVTPRLADQELPVSIVYWEGAVGVEGSREGQPLTGRGYVELTGYADTQGQQRRESRVRGTPEAEDTTRTRTQGRGHTEHAR
jgi:predicted secreted hydrolase